MAQLETLGLRLLRKSSETLVKKTREEPYGPLEHTMLLNLGLNPSPDLCLNRGMKEREGDTIVRTVSTWDLRKSSDTLVTIL